jgi:hypothetical protein
MAGLIQNTGSDLVVPKNRRNLPFGRGFIDRRLPTRKMQRTAPLSHFCPFCDYTGIWVIG